MHSRIHNDEPHPRPLAASPSSSPRVKRNERHEQPTYPTYLCIDPRTLASSSSSLPHPSHVLLHLLGTLPSQLIRIPPPTELRKNMTDQISLSARQGVSATSTPWGPRSREATKSSHQPCGPGLLHCIALHYIALHCRAGLGWASSCQRVAYYLIFWSSFSFLLLDFFLSFSSYMLCFLSAAAPRPIDPRRCTAL